MRTGNGTILALESDFYLRDASLVARDLLGCLLSKSEADGTILSGRIVETEAYKPHDPASHAYRGHTRRNGSMFLVGGRCYVYRIYGIHCCANVVTGPEGIGAAVLIRALEPVEGIEIMRSRRFGENGDTGPKSEYLKNLCDGPGKICQALGITVEDHDGSDLTVKIRPGRLSISRGSTVPDEKVGISVRIGLSPGRGDKDLLRWYID